MGEFFMEFFLFGGFLGVAFVAAAGVIAFIVPLEKANGAEADYDEEKEQFKCDHVSVSRLGVFFDKDGFELTEVFGFAGLVLKFSRDLFMNDPGDPVGPEFKEGGAGLRAVLTSGTEVGVDFQFHMYIL
jgi:hypothetical protein